MSFLALADNFIVEQDDANIIQMSSDIIPRYFKLQLF